MTRHCHNCGEPWKLSSNPGRGEVCMIRRVDPRVAEQCCELRADLVLEKNVGNFCEYFEFARRQWVPKEIKNSRKEAARANL